jgi:O-acetylhomoserine (thiol)-lyase
MNFSTKAIHNQFFKKDTHGALRMPIYDTVAFEFDSAEDIENAFLGKKPSHTYSRITNPTVEHFEAQIKSVSGAFSVTAVSSGMAAIANLIITIAENGDNIITTKHLFGNTYSLFEKTLKPWGLKTKYTDLSNIENIENLIDNKTKAIFLESITNPQLEVVDIHAISKIAKKNNILLIVDATITPLCFYKAKELGIDIEIISSTKYLSGGATSIGGLIIDYGTYNWKNIPKLKNEAKKYGPFTLVTKLKRESYRNLGACLSPHNAYLQCLGLETLTLRVDKSCSNAMEIATYLKEQPKVQIVNYPGLASSKYYKNSKNIFTDKFGALLTFDLASKKYCFKFINNLKIIRRATNLNDNKTLVLHPASTIFSEYSSELKEEMDVKETTIRLSLGIEDHHDLIADINAALEVI